MRLARSTTGAGESKARTTRRSLRSNYPTMGSFGGIPPQAKKTDTHDTILEANHFGFPAKKIVV